MSEYMVLKPVTIRGIRRPSGTILSENDFLEGGAERLMRMGYLAKDNRPVKETGQPEGETNQSEEEGNVPEPERETEDSPKAGKKTRKKE